MAPFVRVSFDDFSEEQVACEVAHGLHAIRPRELRALDETRMRLRCLGPQVCGKGVRAKAKAYIWGVSSLNTS